MDEGREGWGQQRKEEESRGRTGGAKE